MSETVPGRPPELSRPLRCAFYVCVLASVIYTGWLVAASCVNVPFWDDFDAYLNYLLRIEDAPDFWSRFAITSEFHNEHVTFTSRFAVWIAHEIFHGIDFRLLALISAAMLVPIGAMLTWGAGTRDDRAAAAFFSAIFLFNLQHYANLLWGGSSVDHFGVILLSVGALWMLHRKPGPWNFSAGVILACFATFTLAHGMLVFPVGLVVLVLQRRWREAGLWAIAGLIAIGAWIAGYETSRVHRTFHPSMTGMWQFTRFWFGMLGAPLSFGSRAAAPWIGTGVVAMAAVAWRLGALRRHAFHASVLLFAIASITMIAAGRVGLGPTMYLASRYRILACIIVGTLGWMLWRELPRVRAGRVMQLAVVVLCASFVIEKAATNGWRGPAYRDRRFIAASHYANKHTLAGSRVRLYYDIPKADSILAECARREIYDLAQFGAAVPKIAQIPRPVLNGGEPEDMAAR